MARLRPHLPAVGHVPEPDDLPFHRGQGRAIRREANAAVVVGLPVAELSARCRVPDVDRSGQGQRLADGREIGTERCRGSQFRAVGRERDALRHFITSAESADFLEGGQVPEPDRLVAHPRGQGFAAGSENRSSDLRLPESHAADLLPGSDIPQLD
jgi:hypothetical protein